MANISWIKLSVNLFDDEKIKIIRAMPEGDKILLIWIQLLCMAGKVNDKGSVYIGQNMYYTDEMLATICQQPLNIIRLAIQTFINFDMVVVDDEGLIQIENWEKHQNIEGMEKIRAQTRKRVAKHREKQKELTSNVTVTLRNETDIDKELEEELDIEEEEEGKEVVDEEVKLSSKDIAFIIEEWNNLKLQQLRTLNSTTERYKSLKARINDYSFDEVIEAIRNINNSSFLKGHNNRGWTITFDWLVKSNNFPKVLEGNYTDKEGEHGKGTASHHGTNEENDIAKRAGVTSL